jgi:hypothetical protein
MKTDNHTLLDLSKVAYANFYYRNQHSSIFTRTLPKRPTANGSPFNPDDYAYYHSDYPQETLLERAKRLEILDRWTPVCKLQLSNGHTLEYTGDKAKAIWSEWRKRIFKQN